MDAKLSRMKVLTAGICSLLLALGVARFAYTPLLPVMRRHAGLGVEAAGILATLNYMGYLHGALWSAAIHDLALKDRLYRIGMVVAVLSTALMGLSSEPAVWAVSRYLAGMSSAAGLILGSGLIFNWLLCNGEKPELGIHFSGIGLSIALCAVAVELMSHSLDWRQQWFGFSALGAFLLLPALRWFPRPEAAARASLSLVDRPPSVRFLGILMAAYFCAGIGYVVSATFIVAVADALPELSGRGNMIFLCIGLGGAPACILWDLLARRVGAINALILAAALQVFSIVLPLWPGGLGWAIAGAILFGSTVVGIVSLVLTLAGHYYPTRPATMMGRMTVGYSIAQILGPAVTAGIAARSGSYAPGLLFAAASMVLATLLLAALKVTSGAQEMPLSHGKRATEETAP
jgi:predicted MFS family arabinose efflux permease